MVRIITDSICDLDAKILTRYQIEILPLRVIINDTEEYLDRINIDPPKVWESMHNGSMPKTTQIPPDIALSLFERLAKEGQDFIFVGFSAVLSGGCHLVEMLINELREKYPKVKMGVINSKGGAYGEGAIVHQMAHAAYDGMSFEDLMNRGVYLASHIVHIFGLGDMKWLVMGGRVNKLLGNTGSTLDVRPILHVDAGGYLKVTGVTRGQKRMIKAVCDKSLELLQNFPQQIIGMNYSEQYNNIDMAVDYLKDKLTNPTYCIQPIGCVLTAHIGLDGIGFQFFNTKIDNYYYD